MNNKKRILTGDTPTGKLHIGHFLGTLENRVKLQHEYETYILLADIHAYANNYRNSEKINEDVYNVFLSEIGWLMDLGRLPIDPELARLCDEGEIEKYSSDAAGDLFANVVRALNENT